MNPESEPGLNLGELAVDLLLRAPNGSEPYALNPKADEILGAAIEVVLTSEEPEEDMAARFKGVFALCHVLEAQHRCPKAAEVLADIMLSQPEVARIVGLPSGDERRKAAFEQFAQTASVPRAPKVDEAPPQASVKLSSFLNPGQSAPKKPAAGPRRGRF